jgi:hypothetical protein
VLKASGRESRGGGTAAATVETTMHEQGSAGQVKVLTDLDVTGKSAQFGRASWLGPLLAPAAAGGASGRALSAALKCKAGPRAAAARSVTVCG